MPKIICNCGSILRYGDIPNKIEYLFISDVEYDSIEGNIDSEVLYQKMKSILKCEKCGSLWVFWDGYDSEPKAYRLSE